MFQRSQVSADALWRRQWQNGNPKMCDGPTNIWHGQVLETLVCLKISRGLSAIALLSCLDLLGHKQINRPRLFLRETPSDPWASLLSCFESFGIADHLHQCKCIVRKEMANGNAVEDILSFSELFPRLGQPHLGVDSNIGFSLQLSPPFLPWMILEEFSHFGSLPKNIEGESFFTFPKYVNGTLILFAVRKHLVWSGGDKNCINFVREQEGKTRQRTTV